MRHDWAGFRMAQIGATIPGHAVGVDGMRSRSASTSIRSMSSRKVAAIILFNCSEENKCVMSGGRRSNGLRGGAGAAASAEAGTGSAASNPPLSKAPKSIETIKPDRLSEVMVRYRHALVSESPLIRGPGYD